MAHKIGTDAESRPFVAVSARGPLAWKYGPDGTAVVTEVSGGLATALRGFTGGPGSVWVFAAQSDADHEIARRMRGMPFRQRLIGGEVTCQLVETPQFGQMAEVLTKLQLGEASALSQYDTPEIDAAYAAYIEASRVMAEALIPRITPTTRVMVNDHHFYPLGAALREAFPELDMWLYVHMSWSSAQTWDVLPDRMLRPILRRMLTYDMVAFHTPEWGENFIETCARHVPGVAVDRENWLVSAGGHTTGVRAHPLAADKEGWLQQRRNEEAQRLIRELREDPVLHVVAVDRSDPIKNVIRGLRALELVLEDHPDLRGKVVVHSHVPPTRQDLEVMVDGQATYPYRAYLEAIRTEVARINARFQRPGWMPIDLSAYNSADRVAGLLSIYDALLVLSVREGLNVVALEGALLNDHGAQILSRGIGAASLLTPAVFVDQYDVRSIAETLYRVLSMSPDERAAIGRALHAIVEPQDPRAAFAAQVADLDALTAWRRRRPWWSRLARLWRRRPPRHVRG